MHRVVGAVTALKRRGKALLARRQASHPSLTLDNQRGIPVRETLQHLYRIVRDQSIREALVFMSFFGLFLYICFQLYPTSTMFDTNESLRELLLDEEFRGAQYQKNFYEVMTHGEFWEWLEGPLFLGLWPTRWYNGQPFTPDETGYVQRYLRLVGGVQLRQMRVAGDSCFERRFVDSCIWQCDPAVDPTGACAGSPNNPDVNNPVCVAAGCACVANSEDSNTCDGAKYGPYAHDVRTGERILDAPPECPAQPACVCIGRFDTKDHTCFAEFSESVEDTVPFGPKHDPQRYKHTFGHHKMTGLIGFGPTYGTGGYVVELPASDRTRAWDLLAQLKNDTWTDRGTRAVAVSANLYNTQTRMVTEVRILFEFFSSGHITKSSKMFSHKLVVYEAKLDFVRLALEILYCAMLVRYAWIELQEWYLFQPRSAYFKSVRNAFELMLLAVNSIFIYNWVGFVRKERRQDFDVNKTSYTDLYEVGDTYTNTFSWAAGLALCYCLKVFEFLALSKKMSTLWLTLSRASSDITTFFVGFVVIVAGFAFMAENLFGSLLVEFHNFSSSFSTLLRLPLGDFNYSDLAMARPALAAMFFNLYVATVFLVIMNMFIGIITKYFDEVHEEARKVDRWKGSATTWERDALQETVWLLRHVWWRYVRRNSDRRAEVMQELETERAVMDGEDNLLEALRDCIAAAKRANNIDLFRHFYNLYSLPGGEGLYVGMVELCSLCKKDACKLGQHQIRKCEAYRLLQCYCDQKKTTMVGSVRCHDPIESDVRRRQLEVYTVHKISINGVNLMRIICVHPLRGLVLTFSTSLKLRKAIPVANLAQIEESLTNDTQLSMVFVGHESHNADRAHAKAGAEADGGKDADKDPAGAAASGEGEEGEEEDNDTLASARETLYTVSFMTPAHKEQFLRELLDAKEELEQRRDPDRKHKTAARAKSSNPQYRARVTELTRRLEQLLGNLHAVQQHARYVERQAAKAEVARLARANAAAGAAAGMRSGAGAAGGGGAGGGAAEGKATPGEDGDAV